MKYIKLKKMTKKQLVEFLIPLIESAEKINESWVGENNGIHPTDHDFDSIDATGECWATILLLHDDYGDAP